MGLSVDDRFYQIMVERCAETYLEMLDINAKHVNNNTKPSGKEKLSHLVSRILLIESKHQYDDMIRARVKKELSTIIGVKY
jgi:hypothetical protein